MFDNFWNRVKGPAVAGILLLLSAIFILQFGGPQAEGCTKHSVSYAAKVYGTTITEGEFRSAYVLAGGPRYPAQTAKQMKYKERVLDGLVERTLLARAARDLGFDASESEVMKDLVDHGTIYVSAPADAPPMFPSGPMRFDFSDRSGNFNAEHVRNFIQYNLRRSTREFTDSQVEERLAQHMREVIESGVTLSPNELWEAFVRERERVTLEYARFSPVYYRDTLEPTDADIQSWMSSHQADVNREYQRQRHRYTGLEKQVRARHILIKAAQDASDEVKQAARARADALLRRVRAGEDFALLARQNSEDPGSGRRGGDLGFNPRGRMVGPFDEAQFGLTPGQVSDIVETQFGYHIIKVEAVREGDVPEAEAKRELAENLYREARANEMAHEAANRALADVRGGTSMQDLDRALRQATGAPPTQPENPPDQQGEEHADEGDQLAPRVRETEPFGKGDTPIPGPFDSGALVRAAFELTSASPLPREALRLGDDWFVFRLKERTDARRADFTDREQQRLREGLLAQKQREALAVYVRRLRRDAEESGAIRINQEILVYEVGEGEEEEGASAAQPSGDGRLASR